MEWFEYILDNGEPWLRYAVRMNVLHQSKEDLYELRQQALSEPKIESYLNDIAVFHNGVVNNHKNPDLAINKLLFLLEIGLDTDVPEIHKAIDAIMEHKDQYGVYQSLMNIQKHYGGSGKDTFAWCLCDAPLLLYALLKAGIDFEKNIKQGFEHLLSFYMPQGFPCTVSPENGNFSGPGRKDDCCPYATLIMLKLLSSVQEYRNSEISEGIVLALLSLWENSLIMHPYMFYMGTDFRKLKAPAMWYDIVSVTDVLSYFDVAKSDSRFKEMISIIERKQNENGLFTPESVYMKCKKWDFGQKKEPSLYLSYLCNRILARAKI